MSVRALKRGMQIKTPAPIKRRQLPDTTRPSPHCRRRGHFIRYKPAALMGAVAERSLGRLATPAKGDRRLVRRDLEFRPARIDQREWSFHDERTIGAEADCDVRHVGTAPTRGVKIRDRYDRYSAGFAGAGPAGCTGSGRMINNTCMLFALVKPRSSCSESAALPRRIMRDSGAAVAASGLAAG